MPGYNHYPWCTCGWCSGGNGGGGWATSISSFVNISSQETTFIDEEREAKTHLTTCWWCGETVFYHTNGNGDSVLFDSLGWPWEVHSCWADYSSGRKTKSDVSYTSGIIQYPPKPSLYFKQVIDSYIENSPSTTPEDNHLLLLGLAKLMDNVRVGDCSIFGLSEIELSNQINLSVDELRQVYGRFYTRYENNEVSIKTISFTETYQEIETKNIVEKYQLIVSAIKGMKEVKKGGFGFYGLTEDLLAKSMGLSIQDLKLHFGQVYTVYASGNIHLSAKPPKQIRTSLPVPKKTPNQTVKSPSRVSRDKDKILEVRKNNTIRNASDSSTGLIACPYCDGYVSNNKDKINQHIKKKHPSKQLV
jgi:hypothetical protein